LSEDNDEICRGEESKNKLNTTNRVRNKQFVTTAKLPELTKLSTTVIKKASYSTIRKKDTYSFNNKRTTKINPTNRPFIRVFKDQEKTNSGKCL